MSGGRPADPSLAAEGRRTLVEQRLAELRQLLHSHGARGLVLAHRRDFAWLTVGGLNHVVMASETGAAPLLVTRDGAHVLAPVNEAQRIADEEVAGLPIAVEELPWWEPGAAAEAARRHAGGDVLPESALGAELTQLRQRLTAIEHARLEWLGRLARQVVDDVLAACAPGTTEAALAAAAVAACAGAGARTPVLLVAADERIDRYRHPLPTGRAVQGRVMLVIVAERWGLHAALTGIRELEPPSDETGRRQAAVEQVMRRMRESTRPGATLGDVLDAARHEYARLGFADEWRLHHQGGTIGYQGREVIATPGDGTPVEPGMAFAWNPSVRGAKAEETFFLDGAGEAHVVTEA